ncbi:hypothetical protein GOV09_03610 [Candidatus Woesearchaeota archaeon]|nr:hypothetical protein [Candidatus Woesearchaeota archaeon]
MLVITACQQETQPADPALQIEVEEVPAPTEQEENEQPTETAPVPSTAGFRDGECITKSGRIVYNIISVSPTAYTVDIYLNGNQISQAETVTKNTVDEDWLTVLCP